MLKRLITTQSRFSLWRLLAGLVFSSGIGIIAYRRKSLSRSGVVGAILAGTTTVGLGGWSWGLTLIYFFVSSSLLSHWRAREKEQATSDKFGKGSQRDLGQTLANGGIATLTSLGYSMSARSQTREVMQVGYIGAMATATADTWATELGVLSSHAPRMITTGKRTTPGISGGITPLGTGASALGAYSLGTFFWLLKGARKEQRSLPLIALVCGVLGCLFDSVLGATVQARYYCPHCQKETEQRTHNCGTHTQLIHGRSWLDNDSVNFLSTLFGGLVGIVIYILRRSCVPIG